MKINFVLPSIGHSGGIDVVYKYAELMEKAGHDVVIYKEIVASNMYRYRNNLKNISHQGYCSIKGLCAATGVKNRYDKFVILLNNNTVRDADVIIATAWPTAYKVNKLTETKGKKYYFVQDFEIWDNNEYGIDSYRLPLQKIVISTWINNKLNEILGIGPFKVILNGLDSEKFYNSNKIYKLNGGELQFLMLNHSLEKKGVHCGIKAFENAREKFPKIKLKMFGMCSNDNLPEYVEYFQNPSQEQLVKLYCEADVFIFPSIEEGWGLTPLEAMACNCAVVGTETGFVLDIGKNGYNMLVSNPKDIDGMTDNILKLIENVEFLKSISENGRNTITKLNWKNSVTHYIDILEGKEKCLQERDS